MTEQNIHRALIKAMSEVTKVQKSSRNVEQKYDFASIDDFLAMAGPICAANGLYTVMDESDVAEFERQGKYGVTHWLRVRFCLTTYHESGASLPPVYRTVEVIRTGAQSFGSAQSYALKQYLRALLLIPTGDKDDSNVAEKGEGAPSPVQQGNKALAKMTADQFQQITGLIERTASDEAKLCAYFKVAELHDMTAQQADQTIAMLTKKLGAE